MGSHKKTNKLEGTNYIGRQIFIISKVIYIQCKIKSSTIYATTVNQNMFNNTLTHSNNI